METTDKTTCQNKLTGQIAMMADRRRLTLILQRRLCSAVMCDTRRYSRFTSCSVGALLRTSEHVNCTSCSTQHCNLYTGGMYYRTTHRFSKATHSHEEEGFEQTRSNAWELIPFTVL